MAMDLFMTGLLGMPALLPMCGDDRRGVTFFASP